MLTVSKPKGLSIWFYAEFENNQISYVVRVCVIDMYK